MVTNVCWSVFTEGLQVQFEFWDALIFQQIRVLMKVGEIFQGKFVVEVLQKVSNWCLDTLRHNVSCLKRLPLQCIPTPYSIPSLLAFRRAQTLLDYDRSFRPTTVSIWNRLPYDVIGQPSEKEAQ